MSALIGSDIEFAVRDRKTNLFVPAGVVPIKGTKGKPVKRKYGGFEIDCCGVEITPKAADNAEEFSGNIQALYDDLCSTYSDWEFLDKAAIRFESKVLESVREAMTMGCDPDKSAYTMGFNTGVPVNETGGLRSFGGHVHIDGGTPATVVACDVLLGLWETTFPDFDRSRKVLYGRAGAFREKPYGVEYRTLSNSWTLRDDRRMHVFNMANIARKLTVPQIKQLIATATSQPYGDKHAWSLLQDMILRGPSWYGAISYNYDRVRQEVLKYAKV